MPTFCGYNWTSTPREPSELRADTQIGHTSWSQDGEFFRTEYWVRPDGCAELRTTGEAVTVLAAGTWAVSRDWPTHASRAGEMIVAIGE